jgi:hypothetical protein
MVTSSVSGETQNACPASDAVLRSIGWVNEAISSCSAAPALQIPTTRFEGPYEIVQLIWSEVKSIAGLYTAALACCQNQTSSFPTRADLALAFVHPEDAAFSNPEVLPSSVRFILPGDTRVQLPCTLRTIDEFDEECTHISGLLRGTPRKDREAHRDTILGGVLDDPEFDFKAIHSQYADHTGHRNA